MTIVSRSMVAKVFLLGIIAQDGSRTEANGEVAYLTPETLKEGIDSGKFDVLVDVRTKTEWSSGHIEGATFVTNLAGAGTPNEITNASALAGCEYCHIAVYCSSGARAGRAIEHLNDNGFQYLYNGLGVTNWQRAEYSLVNNVSSVEPECVRNATKREECFANYKSAVAASSLAPTASLTPTPASASIASAGSSTEPSKSQSGLSSSIPSPAPPVEAGIPTPTTPTLLPTNSPTSYPTKLPTTLPPSAAPVFPTLLLRSPETSDGSYLQQRSQSVKVLQGLFLVVSGYQLAC